MSQVEKLQKHGILSTPHHLNPEDEKKIETLKDEEIEAMVRIRDKLGDEFIRRQRSKNPTACVI